MPSIAFNAYPVWYPGVQSTSIPSTRVLHTAGGFYSLPSFGYFALFCFVFLYFFFSFLPAGSPSFFVYLFSPLLLLYDIPGTTSPYFVFPLFRCCLGLLVCVRCARRVRHDAHGIAFSAPLLLLHCNVVSLCRGFLTAELG